LLFAYKIVSNFTHHDAFLGIEMHIDNAFDHIIVMLTKSRFGVFRIA